MLPGCCNNILPSVLLHVGLRRYSADAEFFIRQHWALEARPKDPAYYIANYDNMVWATQVLMAGELTTGSDAYRAQVAQFFKGWMAGKVSMCQHRC